MTYKSNYNNSHIILNYEPIILDTGGGVKNAIKYFKDKSVLVINSDILWQNSNYTDIKNQLI